jgi:diguanylate cyclase
VAVQVAAEALFKRRPVLVLAGVCVAALGVWASVLQIRHAHGTGAELWLMAALAVVSGGLAFVTSNPAGVLVVINPAVCFTFAILLSWGLGPAIVAQIAAVAVLTWRRRLPVISGALASVQFVAAFVAAYAVLSVGDPDTRPSGRAWTDLNDAALEVAAIAVWLAVYGIVGYLLAFLDRYFHAHVPDGSVRDLLLFNAALIVLSPVIALASQLNVALVSLMLLPLYAVARMARLSAERDRTIYLDPLTSLANRTMLRDQFDRLAATCDQPSAQPSRQRVAILVLDLDRFKHVNDSLGHEIGDQLLIAVAMRLTNMDADIMVAGRLGGDEFAVLACVPHAAAAGDLAGRVVAALREPVALDGIRVDVTASVGVAVRADPTTDDFTAMLRHADTAMYEAKRRGDSIALYDARPDDTRPERLHLLADFRKALQGTDGDEIVMHYQAQVQLSTGLIYGLEALLRWTHPSYGPIAASTILDVAEHTSVMHRLTERVIDDTTAQMERWRHEGITPRVSININTRDLYSEDIVAHLAQRLGYHHITPHQLQVEVTESALMGDPRRASTTLRRIADLGVGVSLDDFGTGYSSLQHLRRLPLAEIKIDQTFVANMAHNSDDAAIVESTIRMAHALGLRTVAEGVPDEPTSRLLIDMGCDLGQGWHLAHAVPANQIHTMFASAPEAIHGIGSSA